MNKKKLFEEDCIRPACDDVVSMMQQAAAASSAATSISNTRTNAEHATAITTVADCPPGSADLGRSSWTLLHSMAAWYPDKPSDSDQQHMKNFMSALARFYPCTWCATDFQRNSDKKPVQTETRKDLCQWLCEQHNLVNVKTGKPEYPCDMNTLDERWRKSEKPECQGSSLHRSS